MANRNGSYHALVGLFRLTRTTSKNLLPIITVCLLMIVSACGGNQESGASGKNKTGALVIGLTDAQGDFLSYEVDVTEISLTRPNGNTVNVLPVTTRVDFAQYTELTEFVTASMVPFGAYQSIVMTLDYSNADIWVENSEGNAVKADSIQDAEGNNISTLQLEVFLEGRNKLVISNGRPTHLTLDFDLNVSNQVIFDINDIPSLVVEPFLVAEVDMQRPKIHRLRGPIVSVDLADNSFQIDMKPFHHKHQSKLNFGLLKVMVNQDTVYDINNQAFNGHPGLLALSELPLHTPSIVVGKLHVDNNKFLAHEVYAGSSVPGELLDAINGSVLSRQGNTLTVKAAKWIKKEGQVVFVDTVTVLLGESTVVKKQSSTAEHDISEISVGQKVEVMGEAVNSLELETPVLDATSGVVRMKFTRLHAIPADAETNAMSPYFVVGLKHINRCDVSMFNFAGTGMDLMSDADPDNYEVDTGELDLSGLDMGSRLRISGFVSTFGMAPADFTATTLVDMNKLPAKITMNWTPHTYNPFIAIDNDAITLSLDDAGVFHHVGRGGAIVNLSTLPIAPTIKKSMNDDAVYEIYGNGMRQSFSNFSDFVTEIMSRLSGGKAMKRVAASGTFDDETATLSADFIAVHIKNN